MNEIEQRINQIVEQPEDDFSDAEFGTPLELPDDAYGQIVKWCPFVPELEMYNLQQLALTTDGDVLEVRSGYETDEVEIDEDLLETLEYAIRAWKHAITKMEEMLETLRNLQQ